MLLVFCTLLSLSTQCVLELTLRRKWKFLVAELTEWEKQVYYSELEKSAFLLEQFDSLRTCSCLAGVGF